MYHFRLHLTMTDADLRIYDLRQNPVVILPLGPARISQSYLRIVHPIDLDPIEEVVNYLFSKVQASVTHDEILSPILRAKVNKLILTFRKLSPKSNRVKRWDSLGKAWKYISGAPDADDVRAINVTINQMINEENNQIKINSGIDHRVRNITKTINALIANYENLTSKINEGFSSVNLLFNIDELTQQIETIEEAITLTRFNIPSSRLISLTELTAARNFLREQGLDAATTENVLEIAQAYVITVGNSIKYTLRIPMLLNEMYSLYQVEPVISNGTRIHLQCNYYLNGTTPYSSRTMCNRKMEHFICYSSQLEPPSKCIQKLISGSSAQCSMEKVYGTNIVKRINEATVIVNEADLTLKSNCTMHNNHLKGSYLIQFSECAITLDGERFTNINMEIPGKPFIPTTGLKVNATNILDRIPLEYLQILHMAHRDHIQQLNLTNESTHGKIRFLHWLSFGSISLTTILAIAVIIVWLVKILSGQKSTLIIKQDHQERTSETANPAEAIDRIRGQLIPQV